MELICRRKSILSSEKMKNLKNNFYFAALIAFLLCGGLLFIAKMAQNNGDLVRALILSVTSVVITIIYYALFLLTLNRGGKSEK